MANLVFQPGDHALLQRMFKFSYMHSREPISNYALVCHNRMYGALESPSPTLIPDSIEAEYFMPLTWVLEYAAIYSSYADVKEMACRIGAQAYAHVVEEAKRLGVPKPRTPRFMQ